jgi:uncharacterized protein (TIGR03437 family)
MSIFGSTFLKLTVFRRLTLLGALLACGLTAQNAPMTIKPSHPEARYYVDGTLHKGEQVFSWPVKSKHILEVREEAQFISGWRDTRLFFQGWADPSGQTILRTHLIIEADPKVPEYILNIGIQHKLTIWINDQQIPWGLDELNQPMVDNGGPPLPPNPMGLIRTDGVSSWSGSGCIMNSRYAWVDQGTEILLNAIPYPQYAFARWREMEETDWRLPFIKVRVERPRVLRAYFGPALRHTFETYPIRGFRVLMDGSPLDTRTESGVCLPPGEDRLPLPELVLPAFDGEECPYVPPMCTGDRDLIPGTEHVLSAPELQRQPDGTLWVFDHWEWGTQAREGQNYKYVVPKDPDSRTMVAHFVRAVNTSLITSPNGLRLVVDGRNDHPVLNFHWGVGQRHTVTAPAEQTDAQGRRWVFKRWSNDGGATQEVAATDAHLQSGFALRAEYELLGQVTITSDNASPLFVIGDKQCRAPCVLDMPAGTEAVVRVQAEEIVSDDIKVKFLGWLDGDMSTSRTFRFSEGSTVLTAKFHVLNRLRLLSDPEDGVDFGLAPAPVEGLWYPVGAEISLTAEPRPGFRFRRWDGALAGTVPAGSIRLNTPLTVVARMDKIPALKEGAVRNAADVLPSEFVAPGSVIAVDGFNMAAYPEKSPDFPLKQTIQGIYLTAGDRILPLLSVSPETIVALLPAGMKPGSYTLSVHTPNEPELQAEFQVARNAPGLFWKAEGEFVYAEAYHEDGKPVTPRDPARKGELIRILGTGFGPLTPLPVEGFPLPGDPVYRVNDPAQLLLDGRPFPVESVVGAAGRHGLVWLRVRITDAMPAGLMANLAVRVNGIDSQPVALPLK